MKYKLLSGSAPQQNLKIEIKCDDDDYLAFEKQFSSQIMMF